MKREWWIWRGDYWDVDGDCVECGHRRRSHRGEKACGFRLGACACQAYQGRLINQGPHSELYAVEADSFGKIVRVSPTVASWAGHGEPKIKLKPWEWMRIRRCQSDGEIPLVALMNSRREMVETLERRRSEFEIRPALPAAA